MELRDLLDDNTLQFLREDQQADLDTLFLAAYAQDVYAHVAPNPPPTGSATSQPVTTTADLASHMQLCDASVTRSTTSNLSNCMPGAFYFHSCNSVIININK